MKLSLLILTLFLCFNLFGQDWSDKTRVLPDELRKVPVSIYIQHNPNPNYPEVAESNKDYKYVWKHSTSITSPNKELKVISAGSFIWYNEEGWKKNVDYNRRTFSKRFNCPKGILKVGETYTFNENYRFGNNLYGGDALWYIIAEDDNGNTYKGMAILETESELLNN